MSASTVMAAEVSGGQQALTTVLFLSFVAVTLFITVRKIARSRCGSGAALLTDLDTSPT